MLLAPRDRNKTLTALAGAEPVTGAQHQSVQRLQFFLSQPWRDSGAVNTRRLAVAALRPGWPRGERPGCRLAAQVAP